MSKLFVVFAEYEDYDGYGRRTLMAFKTEEKAIKWSKRAKNIYKIAAEVGRKLKYKEYKKWRKEYGQKVLSHKMWKDAGFHSDQWEFDYEKVILVDEKENT